MTKSATDVMQDIIFSAVIDSIQALKTASKGLPNTLLRDVGAIHANVTLADLPEDVRSAIATNVRSAFTRLLKEGYSVMPRGGMPERRGPAPGGPKPPSTPGGRPQGPRRPPKPRG
mgnify:CR=1 FL=1